MPTNWDPGGMFDVFANRPPTVITPAITPVNPVYNPPAAADTSASAFLTNAIESNPDAVYTSYISKFTRPMQEYFANRYNNVYGQYKAYLTDEAKAGRISKKKWSDYLNEYNFLNDYFSQPYINRGGYQARNLAPATKFLPY